MSQLVPHSLDCVTCCTPFAVSLGRSLNVERAPHARVAALAGRLHHFDCPRCGAGVRVEATFGYMDVPRRHWLAVHPPGDLDAWPSLETVSHTAFWEISDKSPMLWNFQAMAMTVRCVFGLEGLREKLQIWDNGLDDAILEVWKLELAARDPTLSNLRFASRAGESLLLSSDTVTVEVPMARYTVLKAMRPALVGRYPSLFEGPFVDHRRLR